MLQKDKHAELDSLCHELEENARKGNSRAVFHKVKNLTKPFQPRTVAIKDNTGKKITKPEKVCHRWKDYCEELYSETELKVPIDVQEREPPPLKEEIRRAMLKAAQRKAPGPDNIAVELLRFGGKITLDKLHEICTEVWESGNWPEEWTKSVFIPLPKTKTKVMANTGEVLVITMGGGNLEQVDSFGYLGTRITTDIDIDR